MKRGDSIFKHLRWQTTKKFTAIILLLIAVWYWFALPTPLFQQPYSTVLKSRDGELLSASIAPDGQWRFPQADSLPEKFVKALLIFEDKRFYSHPGVDPLSLARALKQNIVAGRTVSGGSTLSMQVIRLSQRNKPRTLLQKALEIILATRLELAFSKDEILRLYAAQAPFGGNVVGLEAACWRYFGHTPDQLSWGDAALLAVLPNSPSMIHPGKNRELLKQKRDRLLDKLAETDMIDPLTASLAKEESIPEAPQLLPRHARHLLTRAAKEGHAETTITSTLDYALQVNAEQIIADHQRRLRGNQIHNAAAIVLEVSSGKVLAYVGNSESEEADNGHDVDVITAPRSTGSILKPFLYASMLDDGKLLPRTLLPDVPTTINGFTPKNFSRDHDGAVAADQALIRSLNIPAVHMLKTYRYERFHSLLQRMGMSTLRRHPDHYGLSLILGGAEGTLWDITGMYASMARTLNNYWTRPGKSKYSNGDLHAPVYVGSDTENRFALEETSVLSAASIFHTFDALKEVYRPGEESGWRYFTSSKTIAWKTGTSFGFRDGWAIGVTPEYVVGVWVGNADGEGRPGLTGTDAASPIMFDIFARLRETTWFRIPHSEMAKATVCHETGFRNSQNCARIDTVLVVKRGLETSACPFHRKVHVDQNRKYRLHSGCASFDEMHASSWFVLPPVQEYYFKAKNVFYKPLPPLRPDCSGSTTVSRMDLIYPKEDSRIFIPRELTGDAGKVVFELAHSDPAATVYWHLDGSFIGSTRGKHRIPANPDYGNHHLTIVDDKGETINHEFKVISYM